MVQSYVLHWFQSTSPRWGRRIRITRLRMRFNPRPTRGATSANNARAYTNVFQSTPPREGRHHPPIRCVRSWCFNPRPTRGATWAQEGIFSTAFLFQSMPPREGRHKAFEAYTKFIKFQSTPPREGRPLLAAAWAVPAGVQSTPPHGGRRRTD